MLDDYPLSRDLHNHLGKLYLIEGRVDAAIAQFQDSLPDVDSVYYLVECHARKGDLSAYVDATRNNADEHPADFDAQIDAAQLFGALYLPRDSSLEFQRALALDPTSLEALQGLALAQTDEGDAASAQQTLSRCLTLDAQNYGCLNALGMLDIDAGRYSDAMQALDQAYALAPEAPEALVSLGRLDDAQGSWQQAISQYERAIYVWPYDADAYSDIVLDDIDHGAVQAAEAIALKGISASPDDSRLHYMLGYVYKSEGQRTLALAQFVAAEQSLDPTLAHYAKESASELQHP